MGRQKQPRQKRCQKEKQVGSSSFICMVNDLPALAIGQRRKVALQGLKNGAFQFENLPEQLLDDAKFVLAAMHKLKTRANFSLVSSRLKSNKKFVLAAVKEIGCFLEYASDQVRGNREVVLEVIRQDCEALWYASEELLHGDREIVLAAVRQSGLLSLTMICGGGSGRELVSLEAVHPNRDALRFASRELLHADREIVLEVDRQGLYSIDASVLEFASEEICADREIVLMAVRQEAWALGYASLELCGDRDIVLEAIRQCGMALEDASEALRGDREIVLEAVRQYGLALCYASLELRNDREVVMAALVNTHSLDLGKTFSWASNNLQNDPVLAGALLRGSSWHRLPRDSELMERLEYFLVAVKALPEDFIHVFNQENDVELFARQWEHSVWYKIWLVLQLEPSAHSDGIGRLLVELSGLPLQLLQAKELMYWAPVFGAVLSWSRDWKKLSSYQEYEYRDGDYQVGPMSCAIVPRQLARSYLGHVTGKSYGDNECHKSTREL